jgi:hypothetical protein
VTQDGDNKKDKRCHRRIYTRFAATSCQKTKKKKKNKQNNKTETVLQEGDENAAKLPDTYDSERLTAAAQDKKSPDKKILPAYRNKLDASSSTIGE